MKSISKIFLFFCFVLTTFVFQVQVYAGIHSYKTTSVLSKGKFVKIRIKESGVYKLTFEDLKSMGVNPVDVRIFGYGGALLNQSFQQTKKDDLPEVAIHMEKGSDGIFNSGDYILFYAQGINSWSYDTARGMYIHVLNHYANYGYYFVTSDAGEGRKITIKDNVLPPEAEYKEVNEFVDYAVYEKDLINLVNSGREFFGETFINENALSMNFTFPNVVKGTNMLRVRLDVAATSMKISHFQLSLNSGQVKKLSVPQKGSDHYEKARVASAIYDYNPESDQLKFDLNYIKTTAIAKGYLNFLEVNARRRLIMSGSVMCFQNPDYLGSNVYSKFILKEAGSNLQIWDITDHTDISRIKVTTEGTSLSFYGSNEKQKVYLAIDPASSASFLKPEVVGTIDNQNLHGMPQTDMLIITHPDFVKQAQKLAQAHNDMGEITVDVVTTEQVYNEFSSGTPDATAYRWIMKMLYDRAMASGDLSKSPKYLLLFGRGSFDNRNILRSGTNYVLTFQAENSWYEIESYVTDDYFTYLEDSEGTQILAHTMEIGVGRFPVSTAQEAEDVVAKSIGYMKNENHGMWKNQICYIADDGDEGRHLIQADSVASIVGRIDPAFQVTKIYLDGYQQEVNASGESYPVAKIQFQNLLRNGMLLLDYVGHASATGWTNEQILSSTDVKNLSNKNLPLWIAVTCNFLQFDSPSVSAGENVLLNPVGGGIGILSAARAVYANKNLNINLKLNHYLFQKENGKYPRIGDVIKKSKNALGYELNKLSYIYMGDPAVRLNYPGHYKIVTEKINGSPVAGKDTLRALSIAKFEGYIADKEGNPVNNFNGLLNATIYDKVQTITSLNNDKDQKTPVTYKYRPNTLFSGVTEVVDGRFELTFMLPKDIKYNYGGGRINYYASCHDTGYEAQGYLENFLIGGSNPDLEYETDGPEIKMYLNSAEFNPGDKVNETPMFIAQVKDINGINQVGSGIGHDIMLVVDEDPVQSYILNDYYTSAKNNFTQGTVRFKLPELRSGKHTVTFKVWDLLNNSSVQTVDFEVVKGLEPQIFSVSNYPNPVKSYTKFVIEHDRPESVLKAQVDIFDLSGRRVWSFEQSTLDEIRWDLNDSSGQKLPVGIYLYRVTVQLNSSTVRSRINKLIVVE